MYESDLGLPLIHTGKVRELYAMPDDRLLMVATDNISAFDHVLPSQIPDKGEILNQLSLWWFQQLGTAVDNHVVSTEVPEVVAGRAVICERLEMIGVECVARGYLTGSGWAEYSGSGMVCGIELPAGLRNGSQLPEPIFTPAMKARVGEHDQNVSMEELASQIGSDLAAQLRVLTLMLYDRAAVLARDRGLILADTKFEFGRRRGTKFEVGRRRGTGFESGQRANGGSESHPALVLADEVLTPDSSRFWDAASLAPGGRLESFDKQYVRDWLLHESGWDAASATAPPPLPAAVVRATRTRYVQAYERLTGTPFAP